MAEYHNIWDLKPRQIHMLNLKVEEILRHELKDNRYEQPFTSPQNLDAVGCLLRYFGKKATYQGWELNIRIEKSKVAVGYIYHLSLGRPPAPTKLNIWTGELNVGLSLMVAYANGHTVNWNDRR
jgi:hypothetical protein